MKRVSLIFALALAAKLLMACGHNSDAPVQTYELPQGPMAAKTVVVRTSVDDPKNVQYTELKNTPEKSGMEKFVEQDHKWKDLDNSKVISEDQGYPQANNQGWYFVQQPKDFVAPQSSGSNLTSAWIGTYSNCGYYTYPNYAGYGNYSYYHYYPSYAYNNYYNYNYQPTYYYNYSYWYYQPYAYYPAYYNNYNYYVYTVWW